MRPHVAILLLTGLSAIVLFGGFALPKASAVHSSDSSGDFIVSANEIMRVIQLYNLGEYHCDAGGEDGFAPGAGDRSCVPHDVDYAPQDWRIDLSELLRVLQMYNLGLYEECGGTEDGFCPGALMASGNVQLIPGSSLGGFEGGNVMFGLFDTGTGATRIYLQDGSSRLILFDDDGGTKNVTKEGK
jgi:hypothetical protein